MKRAVATLIAALAFVETASASNWEVIGSDGHQKVSVEMNTIKCVFRTNVTSRFGMVTGDFGNVTGHFGNVTERTGRQDWRCA